MSNLMLRILVLGISLTGILSGQARADILVLDNTVHSMVIGDDGNVVILPFLTSKAIEVTESITLMSGNSSSTTTSHHAGSISAASFALTMDHSIDDTLGTTPLVFPFDTAESRRNFLRIMVIEDTPYSINGSYSMQGPSGTRTFVRVHLLEPKQSGSVLFIDITDSSSTANESFTVGDVGDGDRSNTTNGLLSGTLMAGEEYDFYIQAFISGFNSNTVIATATGCIQLSLGSNAPDLCEPTIDVGIDIKPGSDPNSINPRSQGVVPIDDERLTSKTYASVGFNKRRKAA